MSEKSVWKKLLGVEQVVIEDWDIDEANGALVVSIRPSQKVSNRCSRCELRSSRYDQGDGRRRWRGLDLGTTMVFLEAASPRVKCRKHGVVVAAVPWARPGSAFTREFQDQAAWITVHTNRTAVGQLMRIAWRTVGHIVEVVSQEARERTDLLSGLRRIGIDEVSYRKGHKYLTVVVDHESGRLVWMEVGRDADTLRRFFDALGEERAGMLEIVSADGASWIDEVVRERAPQAVRCVDPFHVVQWATKALDEVRREVWNDLRDSALPDQADLLRNARWALWKNPEDLTPSQRETLAWIPKLNDALYRAYLLKEALRGVFHEPSLPKALSRLDAWLRWARRCRLKPFMKLARTIAAFYWRIHATLKHKVSNALVESRNTQVRLLTRLAHGFKRVEALIGLSMLKLAGLCPPLPGRLPPTAPS